MELKGFNPGEGVLCGCTVMSGIANWEFLSTVKRHPKNRPCGDIDDCEYLFIDGEKQLLKKGKSELNKLKKNLEKNGGFDPLSKTFKIGIVNGIPMKLDGGHCTALLREINEESIAKTGKPKFDCFRVEITDFGYGEEADKRFLKVLQNCNNFVTQHSAFQLNSLNDEESGHKCVSIVDTLKILGVTENLGERILYSNLGGKSSYSNKTLSEDCDEEEIDVVVDGLYKFGKKISENHSAVFATFKRQDPVIKICEFFKNLYVKCMADARNKYKGKVSEDVFHEKGKKEAIREIELFIDLLSSFSSSRMYCLFNAGKEEMRKLAFAKSIYDIFTESNNKIKTVYPEDYIRVKEFKKFKNNKANALFYETFNEYWKKTLD